MEIIAGIGIIMCPILGIGISKRASSVLFGGTDEFILHGNVLAYEYNQSFSISCWFKSTFPDAYIVSKLDSTANIRGWGFYLHINKQF